MNAIDASTIDKFGRAAVLFHELNSHLMGSLDYVQSSLRRCNPAAADQAALGFAAAYNCYRIARHQVGFVRHNRSYDGMETVLALSQDACRRAIWYTDLALEFIVANREDHLDFRRSLQAALDESFVVN